MERVTAVGEMQHKVDGGGRGFRGIWVKFAAWCWAAGFVVIDSVALHHSARRRGGHGSDHLDLLWHLCLRQGLEECATNQELQGVQGSIVPLLHARGPT